MKRPLGWLAVTVVLGLVGISGVWNANAQGRHAPAGGVKQERFVAVQTGEEVQVMTSSEYVSAKKAAQTQYAQEVAKYNQDKKEAAKRKEKFQGQKPVKVEPKKIGGPFKSKEDAEAFVEKRMQDKGKSGK
ncbi:MAG: hypothetical protein ABFC96_00230 [Thermoguttaceae bacterium]